jgi:hypothetical protein
MTEDYDIGKGLLGIDRDLWHSILKEINELSCARIVCGCW